MVASQRITILTVVTLFVSGEVFCPNITGQPSINGTLGGSISIVWYTKNFVKAIFNLFVNNIESENELFLLNKRDPQKNYTFAQGALGKHDDLRERSSAYYYYTGNSEEQETGQVVLTITNLKLEDSGRFLLRDGDHYIVIDVTVLSVNAPEEKKDSGGVCARFNLYLILFGLFVSFLFVV